MNLVNQYIQQYKCYAKGKDYCVNFAFQQKCFQRGSDSFMTWTTHTLHVTSNTDGVEVTSLSNHFHEATVLFFQGHVSNIYRVDCKCYR